MPGQRPVTSGEMISVLIRVSRTRDMAVNLPQVEGDLVWGPPPSSIYVPAS